MTDEVTRHVKAFEKKYGCTLEPVYIEFDQFTQQVSARIASGKALDIVGLHGSNFPSAVIANLFAPLQSGFTTADILDESDIEAGGIDYERSKFFAWNNNLYAVTTRTGLDSATSGAIWYNKKMFDEAQIPYPDETWNWDKLYEVSKKLTKAAEKKAEGKDPFRQKIHLMPPVGWLNDPNGLCQFQGTYHGFFQYSPFDPEGGVLPF